MMRGSEKMVLHGCDKGDISQVFVLPQLYEEVSRY